MPDTTTRQEPRAGIIEVRNPAGTHEIAYVEWGPADAARTVVCVHGLTRNGRDFDWIARALATDMRVVCPDVVGRGRSDWLPIGANEEVAYGYPQYLADVAALIGHLGAERIDWIGTSMGGLIGMMLAAAPDSPVQCLVVNDIGAVVPKAALERIGSYVGKDPRFADIGAVETYLRDVHAPFGPLSDAQWRHLAEHGHRVADDGSLRLGYDPRIGDAFRGTEPLEDAVLWEVWDAIACPVLLFRGAESDLLTADIAAAMQARGPGAAGRLTLHEVPGVGHAPALMDPAQIDVVARWLRE
jgi:pimeloyl-ACP methyl ester carboxylesterase